MTYLRMDKCFTSRGRIILPMLALCLAIGAISVENIEVCLPYIMMTLCIYMLWDYAKVYLPMQKKMDRQLLIHQEEKNDLLAANKEMREITIGLVHDLKRPLRAMASFAQLAKRRLPEYAGEDIKEYLVYITASAERMNSLVDDMQDFAKANHLSIEKEEVIVTEVLDDVKQNIQNIIDAKKVDIITENLPTVLSNRNQLIQVLQNLLENAIKYNEHENPEVVLEGLENKTHHVIAVRDNGIGIGEEYREQVFELFQRLNPLAYEGTGVGLATCKKIVENHHGEIWVESEEGKGTTVYFTLPKTAAVRQVVSMKGRNVMVG